MDDKIEPVTQISWGKAYIQAEEAATAKALR